MGPCEPNPSYTSELEDYLVSTSKRGHRGSDFEAFLDSGKKICGGDEHSQAVSEALARAEALAR